MSINKTKYYNAVLYFLHHCNNHFLGITKLNKLLYYLDFISYRDRKKVVTGDKYVHLDYGPVPSRIDDTIIPEMKKEGLLDIQIIPFKDAHTVKFITKVEPDMSAFDSYENRLLRAICEEFKDIKTEQIVSQTHLESPWYYSEMYDQIDFENAADIDILKEVIKENVVTKF